MDIMELASTIIHLAQFSQLKVAVDARPAIANYQSVIVRAVRSPLSASVKRYIRKMKV